MGFASHLGSLILINSFIINKGIELFLDKMAKRLGLERRIEDDGLKVKVGTLNKERPTSIYIETGMFISPSEEKEEYKTDTDSMEKEINNDIKTFLKKNPAFDKNYICSVEIPYERMKLGKKSYLSLQCHLKQKGGLDANNLLDTAVTLTPNLLSDIRKSVSRNGFGINKGHKRAIYKENVKA